MTPGKPRNERALDQSPKVTGIVSHVQHEVAKFGRDRVPLSILESPGDMRGDQETRMVSKG